MRKPVSVNSGDISSDECQFVVLAGKTSGSICAGSFYRSEHERQVPKDFYRAVASHIMASYGFFCLCIRTLCSTRARTNPSLYDRIKSNSVSLADNLRKKPVLAMIDNRKSHPLASGRYSDDAKSSDIFILMSAAFLFNVDATLDQ